MAFNDDLKLLTDIGPETIAEYERRAGISAQTLLDAIVRDRVRHPPNSASHMAHTKECNDPTLKATGDLALLEETKAYKMLVIIAEFRDGPPESRFSLRHAYNTAGIHRQTLIGWRGDHSGSISEPEPFRPSRHCPTRHDRRHRGARWRASHDFFLCEGFA